MQPRPMIWVGLAGLLSLPVGWLLMMPLGSRGGRVPSWKSQSQDHLHNLTIGLLNYEMSGGSLLPAATLTAGRHPTDLHGWQTFLLPYVEERPLYSRIDLNREWSDAVNSSHFATKLDIYRNPGSSSPTHGPTGLALTDYAANSHVITAAPTQLSSVTDGSSNTIFAGEIDANQPPWGQPRNVRNPADGLYTTPNSFGGPWPGQLTQFSFLDGKVSKVNRNIDPAVLKALATPSGGEAVKLPLSP